MTAREQLHQLIDQLQEGQLPTVLELLRDLAEEEPLTAEDVAAIEAAKADPSPGISTEELCRQLGIELP